MNFNFTLKEGEVYLCYKDNDTLNILTNEKLLISSFENNNRVFYLVSDDLNNFLYTVKANIKGFNKEGYDVSIDCNNVSSNFDNGNISSFIINTDNPSFYEEAIPINIRIKSKNSNDINSMLVLNIDRKPLKINVDEGGENPGEGGETPTNPSYIPMIIAPSISEFSFSSTTDIDVTWGDYVINPIRQVFDLRTGVKLYHFTGECSSLELQHIRIEIKPVNSNEKIRSFTSTGIGKIHQWYGGGYEKFYDSYDSNNNYQTTLGVGAYIDYIPPIAPPNTTDFDYMFSGSGGVYPRPDISRWDMRNAQTMEFFLLGSGLDCDLSNWCVSQFSTEPNGFSLNSLYTGELVDKLPVWGTCPTPVEPGEVVGKVLGDFIIPANSSLKLVFAMATNPLSTGVTTQEDTYISLYVDDELLYDKVSYESALMSTSEKFAFDTVLTEDYPLLNSEDWGVYVLQYRNMTETSAQIRFVGENFDLYRVVVLS